MKWAYFFLILLVLGVNYFFNPMELVTTRNWNAVYYGSSIIAFLYALFIGKKFPASKGVLTATWILVLSILFSSVMAAPYRQQSFMDTFTATLGPFFSYLSFFTFMKLKVPPRLVIRFLLIICTLSILMYICNYKTFPYEMFGGYNEIRDGDDSRAGLMRVTVPMLNGMVVMIFYGLQQWFGYKKRRWIVPVFVFYFMLVISLWRQVMGYTLLLGLLYVLKSASWKIRIISVGAMVAFAIFVLPKIELYQDLKEITENQASDAGDDVRVQDYTFWGNSYQASDLTRVFGNGSPYGHSIWGLEISSLSRDENLTRVDCAWVGFYWTYGIFAPLALIYIIYKAFRSARGKNKAYIRLG
ncbi:MAG: hypothetical protein K2H61_03765, partial [Muribaculaceae bacterium]|nr:hypothetical protein [Muribaculaceae bacterium]